MDNAVNSGYSDQVGLKSRPRCTTVPSALGMTRMRPLRLLQMDWAKSTLKPTTVPESVTRSQLEPELAKWVKSGCPSLGGHMSIDEMRREHQALVSKNKLDVQVVKSSARGLARYAQKCAP